MKSQSGGQKCDLLLHTRSIWLEVLFFSVLFLVHMSRIIIFVFLYYYFPFDALSSYSQFFLRLASAYFHILSCQKITTCTVDE